MTFNRSVVTHIHLSCTRAHRADIVTKESAALHERAISSIKRTCQQRQSVYVHHLQPLPIKSIIGLLPAAGARGGFESSTIFAPTCQNFLSGTKSAFLESPGEQKLALY